MPGSKAGLETPGGRSGAEEPGQACLEDTLLWRRVPRFPRRSGRAGRRSFTLPGIRSFPGFPGAVARFPGIPGRCRGSASPFSGAAGLRLSGSPGSWCAAEAETALPGGRTSRPGHRCHRGFRRATRRGAAWRPGLRSATHEPHRLPEADFPSLSGCGPFPGRLPGRPLFPPR